MMNFFKKGQICHICKKTYYSDSWNCYCKDCEEIDKIISNCHDQDTMQDYIYLKIALDERKIDFNVYESKVKNVYNKALIETEKIKKRIEDYDNERIKIALSRN